MVQWMIEQYNGTVEWLGEQKIKKVHALALWGLLAYIIICWKTTGWVFLIDDVNLVIHEAGHPLFGIFGSRTLMLWGGTLLQLIFPVAFLVSGFLKGQIEIVMASWLWILASVQNVARYLGDAKVQKLPLVGGGEHDWALILGGWGLIDSATFIAETLIFLCIIGVLIFGFVLFHLEKESSL